MFPMASPLLTVGPAAGGGGGTWTPVLGPLTLTSNEGDWQGYTIRQRIPASALTDLSGTQLRYTLGANSQGINIIAMYHGIAGAGTYDFASSPTQVLFGGSASGSCATFAALLTDGAAIAYDGTSDILVSMACAAAGTTGFHAYGLASTQTGYKLGSDASATTGSGYSTYPVIAAYFTEIEALT